MLGVRNIISRIKDVTQKENFLFVCPANCGYEQISLPADSELFIYQDNHSFVKRYWFDRVKLIKIIKKYEPDVILSCTNEGISNAPVPQAMLFHTAYPVYSKKHYPQITTKDRLRFNLLKRQITKSLPTTNLVLTQTPIMKQRFAKTFPYPEDQIKILPWPVPSDINPSSTTKPPSVIDSSSDNFYILILTRYLAHRNPRIIISLYDQFKDQLEDKKIKFITTIEPDDYPGAKSFLEQIQRNGVKNIVINVGSLAREEVLGYYLHCHVLWLPTLAETLCLPYLEAMAMGLPVMAPDLDFARYVCCDAATYYNPFDIESIFRALMRITQRKELRQTLTIRGKRQLADNNKFAKNWDELAKSIMKSIANLVGK